MNKIFIEAKDSKTPEAHFIKAIIESSFSDKVVSIVCMNGIGQLFNETILNQIKLAQESGDQVIVLADADTVAKGYGYAVRKEEIDGGMTANNVSFPYFLYPDNQGEGDVENLMESAARRDLHSIIFDCFEDYEKCVSGKKDESGQPLYNTPDLKGKLHTYMTAQKLTRRFRNRLGSGDWLFDNPQYWNLNVEALQPLKEFLAKNLK